MRLVFVYAASILFRNITFEDSFFSAAKSSIVARPAYQPSPPRELQNLVRTDQKTLGNIRKVPCLQSPNECRGLRSNATVAPYLAATLIDQMKVDSSLRFGFTSSVCRHVNIISAALWRERWRESPDAIRRQRLWGRYFGKQLPYEHFFLERSHRDKNYKRLAIRSKITSRPSLSGDRRSSSEKKRPEARC